MKISLGRIVILVHDYDEAFTFYAAALKATKIFDETTKEGQRFLHIGFDGNGGAGIWFLKAEREEEKNRVGRQTVGQPAFVLYTDSLESAHERLLRHNVKVVRPPSGTVGYKFLHFLDLYGNEIVLVEMVQ